MRPNPWLPPLAAISLLLASTLVDATAQRTFVASTGVDNLTCSLASPCRGFAAAITATTAGGEVIVLDSAGYGPLTITKAVSLIAPAGIYAGISVASGDGITVNAPGATVVLRGLTINGVGASSGSGINIVQATRVRIESCVVSRMGVDGVIHSAAGAEIIVLDTIVRDNGASGIGGDADALVVLDHVRSEHNGTNGFYLAPTISEARAIITDSLFAFNAANGIWVASVASPGVQRMSALVERSVLADNGGHGLKIGAASNGLVSAAVTRNAIRGNGNSGVSVGAPSGFAEVAVSENTFLGNGVGISALGDGMNVHASANHLTDTGYVFAQSGAGRLYSYGNNTGGYVNAPGSTISDRAAF